MDDIRSRERRSVFEAGFRGFAVIFLVIGAIWLVIAGVICAMTSSLDVLAFPFFVLAISAGYLLLSRFTRA